MNKYGFFRLSAGVPAVKIADPAFNAAAIIDRVKHAVSRSVDCIVFPELSITGYTCADLFHQQLLLSETETAVKTIVHETATLPILFAVGAPIKAMGKIYNSAIVIYKGRILGAVPKSYLPNYGEFYEKRWFESGKNIRDCEIEFSGFKVPFGTDLIFNHNGVKIGVEICEDLWVAQPPSGKLAMAGATVILNLSASDDLIGKHDYLLSLIAQQSARCRCAYAYSSAGWGESSTDLVFSGKAIIGVDGAISEGNNLFETHPFSIEKDVDIEKLLLDREKFNTFTEAADYVADYRNISTGDSIHLSIQSELTDNIDPWPFVPQNPEKLDRRCEEIINIQAYGLMKRLEAIKCNTTVVGISGGLDSALALLVTVKAFDRLKIDRKGIIGVTMPGLATTSRTKSNAQALMEQLGITSLEIPIGDAVDIHFRDIKQPKDKFDAAYENSQARERTQILMDLANKEGGIVIGTGDMSELALGWCTYNGDQMSMYGVNASVPKTLVKHLVKWVASQSEPHVKEILLDICDTPISPELVPSGHDDITQKTEDLVGPYELHDFFLYHFLRNSFSPNKIYFLARHAFSEKYSEDTILKWLKTFFRRFFSQQFKRSCMPDGPKVGSVNLSPRGDWRMPSDASSELWLRQLDEIK